MTLLVLIRDDAARVAGALRLLQPAPLHVVGLYDPLPPHELRLAQRALLGRSERGRPGEARVAAAGHAAARAAAEALAAEARSAGVEVAGVEVSHPGPKEIDELVARVRPTLVVLELHGHPVPPPLRHLAERGSVPVLLV